MRKLIWITAVIVAAAVGGGTGLYYATQQPMATQQAKIENLNTPQSPAKPVRPIPSKGGSRIEPYNPLPCHPLKGPAALLHCQAPR